MKKSIITVVGKDQVGIIAKVCTYLAENNINIENMTNKSRGDVAYTVTDIAGDIGKVSVDKIKNIEGIIRVRVI